MSTEPAASLAQEEAFGLFFGGFGVGWFGGLVFFVSQSFLCTDCHFTGGGEPQNPLPWCSALLLGDT